MSDQAIKRSFPPVVAPDTRVLLLGSLPGERSLAEARYYAHPRNHFWRLAGAVIGNDLVPLGYDERLATLLRAGIGLWDVVGSARRTGSLDGNIRDLTPNALRDLARSLPQLRAVGFNGGASARVGMRALAGEPRLAFVPLPSSSPAFTRPFDEKLAEWMKLRNFL